MSQFLHVKDDSGIDLWYGDCDGQIKLVAFEHIKDYSKQLDVIRKIDLRPDDILVVGYSKSGNNWTHNMVSMLQRGSAKRLPAIDSDNFLYVEYVSDDHQLASADKPRVVISHLPFRFLPSDVLKKKVKLVHVTRNPKDVFVSFYCHLHALGYPNGYPGTWSQFFSLLIKNDFVYGNVFDHMRDYEKVKELHPDHPIYECRYEETKRDTLGQLRGLNRFMGLNRSEQLLREIVDVNQIPNMGQLRPISQTITETTIRVKASDLYRKGIVGDWKNWFTVAQNEQFEEVYAAKMAGSKLAFEFE